MYSYFVKLLNMSLASSVLILAVLAVRLLLRKAPRRLVCLLWVIVALRLIVPVSIHSALSAFNYIGRYHLNNGELSYIVYDSQVERPEAEIHLMQSLIRSDDGPTMVMNSAKVYLPALMNLWAAGVVILVLYAMVSYLRIYQHTRVSMKLRGNIYQCDSIPSPFILGLFFPRIYLPSNLDAADIKSVVAHERAHIARWDHVWKPLGYALLCIHWFNPLVWVSYILLCRDIELACDEKVIANLTPEQKQCYSAALLRCSVPQKIITACPLAFGEVGVKERVKGILNYKKPAFWVIIVTVILCIILAACFLTNPKMQEQTVDPLMGFAQFLPEGYTMEHSEGRSYTISKDGEVFGRLQSALLDIPEDVEDFRDYAWAHQQELWTQFGIDFDNEYLEYMTNSSLNADCEGWFAIYDPDTQVSQAEYHYLYLVTGAGYDLTVTDESVDWLSVLFARYLGRSTESPEPEDIGANAPGILPTDITVDLTMFPGNDPQIGVKGVINSSTGTVTGPNGADNVQLERCIFTVDEGAMIFVMGGSTVDGKPRWILHPLDENHANIEVREGLPPIPVDCDYQLINTMTGEIPFSIQLDTTPMADFKLPKGYSFQPLSRNDELMIRENAIVGEVRRDAQIWKFLNERNSEEISRYLSRSLQDGWMDEYMIQFWENSISVNYQITEEETRERVNTTHWFFERDGGAYELVFYGDMITDEESRDVLNAMGIVR